MKHEGFTPIGQTAATGTPSSRQLAGSNAGQTAVAPSHHDTRTVAAWLARQAPADMDKAAVSRALSHGAGLAVRYELRFPSGPNGERLPSYQVAVGCDVDGSPEAVEAALADLRNFMTPAPIREIEGWLAELSVITAKRQDDGFAEELRVTAYSSRLSRYPADVVRSVLLKSTYRFFPTWDELEKRCAAMTGPRLHMIAALERGPTPEESKRRPATDDEKARIAALVDEIFPMRSKEMRDAAVAEMVQGDCMKVEP